MKPKTLLRIASISMFLHAVGHTVGALSWKKDPDPNIQRVVDEMISYKFTFGGALRSIGDFYEGYGVTMIFVLLYFTVLLWQLAAMSASYPDPTRRLLVPISISLLVIAFIEFRYFFFLPGIFTSIAGMLAGWSALSFSKNKTVNPAAS